MIRGISGFESFEGASFRITGLGGNVSTAFGRNGGHGMGVNGLGNLVGGGFGLRPPEAIITPQASVGFAFKNFSDKPWGGSVQLCRMVNTEFNLTKAVLAINAQKQLEVYSYDRTAGTTLLRAVSSGRAIKDDAWHYLELLWGSGGGAPTCANGAVSAYVNGTLVVSFSGSTDVCPVDSPDDWHPIIGVNNFYIGNLSGFLNEEHHMAWDDVYGSYIGDIVGDCAASELELESDALDELTPVPGPNHFEMVNEDPADDEATYNMNPGLGRQSDTFEIVDVTGDLEGRVLAVQLTTRLQKTTPAIWVFQSYVEVEGNPYPEYHVNEEVLLDWQESHRVFWSRPGPPDSEGYTIESDWDWDDVQNLRAGYTLFPASNFNQFRESFLGPVVYTQV